VGASLENTDRDAISVRQDRPYVFTNLKDGDGVRRDPWSTKGC
jgi:Ni2+-binding GTPase involved in maturation of urease and hydrogenase